MDELKVTSLAKNVKDSTKLGDLETHITAKSSVAKKSDESNDVDSKDLHQCFVLTSASKLRERQALVRGRVVHLMKEDSSQDTLEVVMSE